MAIQTGSDVNVSGWVGVEEIKRNTTEKYPRVRGEKGPGVNGYPLWAAG